MFTGIIEEIGTVSAIEKQHDSIELSLRCSKNLLSDVTHGASISVSGVCLTVTRFFSYDDDTSTFSVDVMQESLDRSALGRLCVGSPVNLERAVKVSDRLGGHVVQGHVDGVGTITAIEPGERWTVVRLAIPQSLARYVVEKGSVTLDGISLTVSRIQDTDDSEAGQDGGGPFLEVSLIPTTLQLTTLGRARVGEAVNIEVDVLAKYVERLLAATTHASATEGNEAAG
jgi:riboflavin synthase